MQLKFVLCMIKYKIQHKIVNCEKLKVWRHTIFTPPPPCHNLSHFLRPPPPWSVTYFMDGPYELHPNTPNFFVFITSCPVVSFLTQDVSSEITVLICYTFLPITMPPSSIEHSTPLCQSSQLWSSSRVWIDEFNYYDPQLPCSFHCDLLPKPVSPCCVADPQFIFRNSNTV